MMGAGCIGGQATGNPTSATPDLDATVQASVKATQDVKSAIDATVEAIFVTERKTKAAESPLVAVTITPPVSTQVKPTPTLASVPSPTHM